MEGKYSTTKQWGKGLFINGIWKTGSLYGDK